MLKTLANGIVIKNDVIICRTLEMYHKVRQGLQNLGFTWASNEFEKGIGVTSDSSPLQACAINMSTDEEFMVILNNNVIKEN